MSTAELAKEVGCDPGTVQRVKQRIASKPPEPVMLAIDSLNLDYGTQMRPNTDEKWEISISESMLDGVVFDPIEVYRTPSGDLPTDGWHRIAAALRADLTHIRAIIIEGTEADAIRAACRANARGSLPRCVKAKRNSVLALIGLYGAGVPVNRLATECLVSYSCAKDAYDSHHARLKVATEAKGEVYDPEPITHSNGRQTPALAPTEKRVKPSKMESKSPAHEVLTPPAPDDDDDDIPFEPSDGPLLASDLAEAAKVSKEEAKAIADQEWLEGLYRDEGKIPVRERLTAENRAIHDADALAYRKIHDGGPWASFASVLNTAIESKKIGGAKGLYARAVSRFLRLKHPKDWVLCFWCHGSGLSPDGNGSCDGKCKGLGYTID